MARPLIVTQLHEILNAMAPRHRKDRRSRVSRIPVAESLECRGLMSITASGVISSTPDGSNYNYTIQLTNSSTSTEGIGFFCVRLGRAGPGLSRNKASFRHRTGKLDGHHHGRWVGRWVLHSVRGQQHDL